MMGKKADQEWPDEMIRRLRQRPSQGGAAKLRQIDLAKHIGVETRTVQQWENGERLPSAHNLQKLIQVFVAEGKFVRGSERPEAQALWETVRQFHDDRSGNNRVYPIFDEQWFEAVLADASVGSVRHIRTGRRDEGEQGSSYESAKDISAPNVPTNMPGRMSKFIGRREQLVEIGQLLADSPLVTLAGSGGSGKTRLACQAASNARHTYPDGVWLFELAPATEPLSILRIVASVLGVKEQKEHSLAESLLESVRNKRMLLVFDNCEHLIDFCSSLIERMLSASPYISILATSQEPLNISMESVWRVPPLTFPTYDEQQDNAADRDILSYESVQLFIERATTLTPHFRVTQDELKVVARICERLEGIPLSIELAAARTNVLSLEQIDERLSDLFALLSAGKRTAAARHQSLRATIDWSFAQLTEQERQLLRRLSVFTGGFELEAVENICADLEPDPSLGQFDKSETLDLVANLFDKSFLSADMASIGNRLRYSMLETIKQYAKDAWEKHGTDEERERLISRFIQHYCRYIGEMERGFRSRDRDTALMAIRREYANIRSALMLACDRPQEAGGAVRMAASLYYFWLHVGALNEGAAWLLKVLEMCRQHPIQEDAVKAKHGLGVLLWVMGEYEKASVYALQSTDEARKLGNPALLASHLRLLTQISSQRGLEGEAIRLAEESVHHARESGDDWSLASSLSSLGNALVIQGKWNQAEPFLAESADLFEKMKDYWELSGPLRTLGYIAINKREHNEAVAFFKRSIAVCQTYQGTWFLSRGVEGLAGSLCFLGEYRKAATLIGASETLRKKLGSTVLPQFQPIYEHAVQACKQQCGDKQFDEAYGIGRGMTREQTISYALEF